MISVSFMARTRADVELFDIEKIVLVSMGKKTVAAGKTETFSCVAEMDFLLVGLTILPSQLPLLAGPSRMRVGKKSFDFGRFVPPWVCDVTKGDRIEIDVENYSEASLALLITLRGLAQPLAK